MKKSKITKISLLVLSLALIVGAVCAVSASAEDTTPTPDIKNQNVYYTDAFHLMFAVDASTVSNGVKLYRYDEDPTGKTDVEYASEYTAELQAAGGEYGLPYDAYVFITDGVSATALDKVIYVQAEDGDGNKSAVKSYSVVEYLYTRLAEVDGVANTDEQNGLYKSVIDFGTYAQKNFLESDVLEDTTLISNYCYVSTEGCTVDGKTAAVLPQGKAFDVAGDNGALSKCTVTTYDTYDTAGTATETTVNGATVTITDSARAHIIAGAAKTYKEGTETFDSYEAGVGKPISNYNDGRYMFYGNDGTLRSQTVAEDKVYGSSSTVLPLALTAGQVTMLPISSNVKAEDATAFEYSFDLKMDITKTLEAYQAAGTTSAPERIGWYFYLVDIAGKNIEKDIVRIFANYGNQLRVDVSLNWANYVISETPASEWHNIRIVFKNPDENTTTVDFYLDGAEEATTYTLKTYIDIKNIGAVRFTRLDSKDTNTVMYFDNVWCGYTNE